jgi:hypothetical protein
VIWLNVIFPGAEVDELKAIEVFRKGFKLCHSAKGSNWRAITQANMEGTDPTQGKFA